MESQIYDAQIYINAATSVSLLIELKWCILGLWAQYLVVIRWYKYKKKLRVESLPHSELISHTKSNYIPFHCQ